MLYYANALPQYATKLLRLDPPVTGDSAADWEAWKSAKAEMWQPETGWTRYSGAQAEILGTGDWDGIDAEEVVVVQANMIVADEWYAAKYTK
jgi:hypothetical protein